MTTQELKNAIVKANNQMNIEVIESAMKEKGFQTTGMCADYSKKILMNLNSIVHFGLDKFLSKKGILHKALTLELAEKDTRTSFYDPRTTKNFIIA